MVGTGSNRFTNGDQGGGNMKSGLPNALSSAGVGMMFGRTYRGGPSGHLANYKTKNKVFCINQIGGIGSKGGGRSLFKMMDGLGCKGGLKPTPPSLPADSLTFAPTPAPTPAATLAAIPTPYKCSSISRQVTDQWCQRNCTETEPPICPTAFCKCEPGIPLISCPTDKGPDDFFVIECQKFVADKKAACCKEGGLENKCYNTETRECCPNHDGFNYVCPIGKCSTRPGTHCD